VYSPINRKARLSDSNPHHRRSIRLQDYDYSQAGAYFITICTHEHKCIFGDIVDGKMILSQSGEIVEEWWQKIPLRFPTAELDISCVMPNHFHGILLLQDKHVESYSGAETAPLRVSGVSSKSRRGLVSKPRSLFGQRPLDPQHPTLGQIIAYFKYLTTKQINALDNAAGLHVWQRNYFEHVIRNELDLAEKREYIANNPKKWELDRYYVR
jgi:putative transposase